MDISNAYEILKGLTLRTITLRRGQGRVVTFSIEDFELKIYPFYELINKSFNPQWGFCPPPEENLGVNIPQLLVRSTPESKRIPREEIFQVVFACNTTHTNFVRGNGFVIIDNELICKPPGAAALDGDKYQPLGYHPADNPNNAKYFPFEALVLAPHLKLQTIEVNKNTLHVQTDIQLAISGPVLVKSARNVVRHIPIRMKALGQTFGNEINYDPYSLKTSFTAFGIEKETNKLIVVSMFAGRPGMHEDDIIFFAADRNQGITLNEMAELMINLGASDAIAGGGAGDTQQYIFKQGIWAGQPRHQPDRPQVEGLRGLGAILALLKKN